MLVSALFLSNPTWVKEPSAKSSPGLWLWQNQTSWDLTVMLIILKMDMKPSHNSLST